MKIKRSLYRHVCFQRDTKQATPKKRRLDSIDHPTLLTCSPKAVAGHHAGAFSAQPGRRSGPPAHTAVELRHETGEIALENRGGGHRACTGRK